MARGKSFSAAVTDWAGSTETRIERVFQQAALDTAEAMSQPKSEGGHLPVLTGRLRRSLAASTAAMPEVDWRAKDFPENWPAIMETIRGARIGQTVYLGFRAPYAMKAELADGNGFVRLTAQRWPAIVDTATAEVKRTGP